MIADGLRKRNWARRTKYSHILLLSQSGAQLNAESGKKTETKTKKVDRGWILCATEWELHRKWKQNTHTHSMRQGMPARASDNSTWMRKKERKSESVRERNKNKWKCQRWELKKQKRKGNQCVEERWMKGITIEWDCEYLFLANTTSVLLPIWERARGKAERDYIKFVCVMWWWWNEFGCCIAFVIVYFVVAIIVVNGFFLSHSSIITP